MASGWWDDSGAISGCVAAYAPVGSASLAASYVNLQNPGTYNASPGTAPSFDTATGWTFNGTSQWLTTGYTQSAASSTISILVRFSGGSSSGNRALLGITDNPPGQNLGIWQRLSGATYFVNGGGPSQPAAVTSGVLGIATTQGFLNGATYGGAFSAATKTWFPLSIGAYYSGSVSQFFSGQIQAIAIYNTTLTAGQVATLTTLMNALPTSSQSIVPHLAAHTDWWHG